MAPNKLPYYMESEIQSSQHQQWKIACPPISHTYRKQEDDAFAWYK